LDLSLGPKRRDTQDRYQDETRPGHCKHLEEENLVKTKYTLDQGGLYRISELPTESALQQAAAFLADLVKDRAFLDSLILPLAEEAEGERDWYVARHYGAERGTYSLKVFVWPSGTGTQIHDHSS
jgi:hypothetical protein